MREELPALELLLVCLPFVVGGLSGAMTELGRDETAGIMREMLRSGVDSAA